MVDDNDTLREALADALDDRGLEVVGQATNGRAACDAALVLQPDVVVMDISMPELNGVEATRQIVKQVPGTEVPVLTVHRSEDLAREVLRAGARAVVLTCDADEALISAVEAAPPA